MGEYCYQCGGTTYIKGVDVEYTKEHCDEDTVAVEFGCLECDYDAPYSFIEFVDREYYDEHYGLPDELL